MSENIGLEINVLLVKLWVVIVSLVVVYLGKKVVRWVHSYMLFILSFLLFNFSRLFLDLLNLTDFTEVSLYKYYYVDDFIIKKSLLILCISLLSVSLSFSFVFQQREKMVLKNKKPNIHLGLIVFFLLLLPGTLLKLKHDFSFVSFNTYVDLYNSYISSPLLYRLSWYVTLLLIPLFLVYPKEKKIIFSVLFIYLIIGVLDSLKGSRGALVKPLAFCMWYYYKFFNRKDVNLFKIFILGLGFILIMQLYLIIRTDINIDLETLQLILPLFFAQQGVSFTLFPLYFDFGEYIINPNRFYILYPITSNFQRIFTESGRDGHTFDFMSNTLSLDHKIMYAINPEAYLNGYGIGSSYTLELYILGGILGVIFGSFLIGFLINKFERIVQYNNYYLIFSIAWIENLVWMNRGSYFPEFIKVFGALLLLFLYRIIFEKK
jgi:oligosaccharide repeat unit polymerase